MRSRGVPLRKLFAVASTIAGTFAGTPEEIGDTEGLSRSPAERGTAAFTGLLNVPDSR